MSNRQELIEQVTAEIPDNELTEPQMALTKEAQVVILDGDGGAVVVSIEWFMLQSRVLWQTILQLAALAEGMQGDGNVQ